MAGPRGLVQVLDQGLHRSGLLPRGARLLVAVSGGADSVALLRLLCEVNRSDYWGWRLVVGHVEHGIRGEASVGDAEFVRGLAGELGVGFVIKRLKLGKGASEGVARTGRMKAFSGMVKLKQCVGVVMGHHGDDQAETVVMRMMRGGGGAGLAGFGAESEVDGLRIFRPLLGVRRAALRGYLEKVGQDWREDASNGSGDYLRNRVRGELMPVMERMGEGVVEAIGRVAVLAGEMWEVMEGRVREVLEIGLIVRGKREIILRREVLQKTEVAVCGEIVRVLVVLMGGTTEIADFERVREAVRVVRGKAGGKVVEMGGGVVVSVGGGVVKVGKK